MSRLGIINIAIGFWAIFIASCGGFFISFDLTELFVHNPDEIHSWFRTLLRSSHGHVNLFGFIHVFFGLTLSVARTNAKTAKLQTIGLTLGTSAMAFGMILRAFGGPNLSYDAVGIIIGICLSSFLVALLSHTIFLSARVTRT